MSQSPLNQPPKRDDHFLAPRWTALYSD